MGIVDKVKAIVPESVRPFLLRALILLVAWNLTYHLWLKPAGVPDNQLTKVVEYGTVKLLSLFYDDVYEFEDTVYINGVNAVNIAPECNGLELIVLYLGFILCMPTNWKRMTVFSIVGSIVIYALNLVRSALLAAMYYVSHSMTDFAHHYAFKIVIYGVVFAGWMLYIKKPKKGEV